MVNDSEIVLRNTAQGVVATFYGPKSIKIVELFNTDTLPCPFSNLGCDTADAYVREMRKRWPGFDVSFM